MYNNKTGYFNVSVGASSGSTYINYAKCTFVGMKADASGSLTNSTAIGYGALVNASNKVRVGNASVNSIGGQVEWTSFSDERIKTGIKQNVPGLAFINLLRPVTYHFNIKKENELMGVKKDDDNNADIEKISFTGLLAQEVDKAAQKINYDFSGVDKTGSVLGLRYSAFVVPLIKAVQELSRQNDSLKNNYDAKIDALQKQIDELKALIVNNTSAASNLSRQTVSVTSASLEQNIPNPFNNTTTINYNLPQKFSSAQIIITDQNGKTLKRINVAAAGMGSVNIDATTLSSAAYNYSLLVDGKLIDTKKMILTK